MTVVLSLVEIFSGAPPMLGVDLTHTGPLHAVSLVTSAPQICPRDSFPLSFLQAKLWLSPCPGRIWENAGERALPQPTGPPAIGLALGAPLFPYKGMWDGEKPVPS